MAKRKKTSKTQTQQKTKETSKQTNGRGSGTGLGKRGYLFATTAGVVLVVLIFWWIMRGVGSDTAGSSSGAVTESVTRTVTPEAAGEVDTPAPTATQRVFTFGRANYCQAGPRFGPQFGFEPGKALIGTSVPGYVGLALVDPSTGQVAQHQTWDDGGNLGSFVYDANGNVYAAPAPFINTTLNPPDEQNRIFRADTDSALMTEFVDLPPAAPMTENNPFGVMGLFYDCDTNSLYAGSVAGSTANEEVGRIFRVDVATGTVADTLENVDAMGVGVFNLPDGNKRLYFGSGRDTSVRSIALDEDGNFVGEPRQEFFLAQFEGSDNDKGQRITFTNENQMVVKGIDFNYTLRAASEPRRNLYTFVWDRETSGWVLQGIEAG